MSAKEIEEVKGLEQKFWQAMVDQDADTAVGMLTDKALMTSAHGAISFDHAQYRKMADAGPATIAGFKLGEIHALQPIEDVIVLMYEARSTLKRRETGDETSTQSVYASTWVRVEGTWKCAAHSDSPKAETPGARA